MSVDFPRKERNRDLGKVFLTDAQQRKTLSAARSLGKKGMLVSACEVTGLNPTRFSKYCKSFTKCPDPAKAPGDFIDYLSGYLTQNPHDVLYPMDDYSMKAVVENRKEMEKICNFAIPSAEDFNRAYDKGKAVETARNAGVECPRTTVPESVDDLEDAISGLDFPLVIKPARSSGSRGIRIVKEKRDFAELYIQIHEKYPFPLIQEYIPVREKYDVCLIYNRESRLRASFTQREIRNFPQGTGPSTVQESVVSPLVEKAALKIMENYKWQGVVELEFLVDERNGRIVFMEINPRFWASLELAVLSGVNFPYLYYNISIDNDCEKISGYKSGVKTRWLWPGDILHYFTCKDKAKMSPPFFGGKRKGVFDDTFSRSDPLPLLGVLFACGYYLVDGDRRRFILDR